MTFHNLTGSTADTFLEYIERNLPEGIALKITKVGSMLIFNSLWLLITYEVIIEQFVFFVFEFPSLMFFKIQNV